MSPPFFSFLSSLPSPPLPNSHDVHVASHSSKTRRLGSRQILDYFGSLEGGSSSSTPPPSSLSTFTQTDMTLNSLADMEGRSQSSSQVASLQSRVAELEHILSACKEKLESTTDRLNKCLSVGKQLLIEKVGECGVVGDL